MDNEMDVIGLIKNSIVNLEKVKPYLDSSTLVINSDVSVNVFLNIQTEIDGILLYMGELVNDLADMERKRGFLLSFKDSEE